MRDISHRVIDRNTKARRLREGVSFSVYRTTTVPAFDKAADFGAMIAAGLRAVISRAQNPVIADEHTADGEPGASPTAGDDLS